MLREFFLTHVMIFFRIHNIDTLEVMLKEKRKVRLRCVFSCEDIMEKYYKITTKQSGLKASYTLNSFSPSDQEVARLQ